MYKGSEIISCQTLLNVSPGLQEGSDEVQKCPPRICKGCCKPECAELPYYDAERKIPDFMNMTCECPNRGIALPLQRKQPNNFMPQYHDSLLSEDSNSFCCGYRVARLPQLPLRRHLGPLPIDREPAPIWLEGLRGRRPTTAPCWDVRGIRPGAVGGRNMTIYHSEMQHREKMRREFPFNIEVWRLGSKRVCEPHFRSKLYPAPNPIREFWRDGWARTPCKPDPRVLYQSHERDIPPMHNFYLYRGPARCDPLCEPPAIPLPAPDVHKLRYMQKSYMTPDDWYM